jgi:hypothetical protein
MEHLAGCPALDLTPFMHVLGAVMIFLGCVIQYFGLKVQKDFIKYLVNICTFMICVVVFYKLDWFAAFDPTDADKNTNYVLTGVAIVVCFAATIAVSWTFKKFISIAPTIIGFCAGYWFSVYLILIINGVGGLFVPANTQVIGSVGGALTELFCALLGAGVGYKFSFILLLTI